MECTKCGVSLVQSARFCGKCGQPVRRVEQSAIGDSPLLDSGQSSKESVGLFARVRRWNQRRNEKLMLMDPIKVAVNNINFCLIFSFILLFGSYGSVQITLLGNGKITHAYTYQETVFFVFYVVAIAAALVLNHKRLFLYNLGVLLVVGVLAFLRLIGAYEAEPAFGTTITVNHVNVWSVVGLSLVALMRTFKLYKKGKDSTV